MTRSQNSGVPPYQDIGRLEREIWRLQRQQLMADQRNPRDGDLGPQHQQVPALDEDGKPLHDEDGNPIYEPQEERLDPQDGRDRNQQAPPEANPPGVGDNLNLLQPANVVNAQHPLNVTARHPAYVPPLGFRSFS
ncbi:unnamed protein product [Arabidopsis arenosa]|uniref:Uncharacterized protein n=1 Tax=Arabidopsis arenosa TaxID=38785 RepID=A0A8S1ZFL9_ARAAE|nr:unnamed protein product [Arabidopsis arenosa]